MSKVAGLVGVILVACPGCVVEEGTSDAEAGGPTVLHAPPRTVITEKGAVLRLLGPARIVADATPSRARRQGSSEAADHELDHMTPEDLAEALRPVTVINGYEYIGEPDVDIASTILEGIRLSRQPNDANTSSGPPPVASDTLAEELADTVFNVATMTNTTVNPYSA